MATIGSQHDQQQESPRTPWRSRPLLNLLIVSLTIAFSYLALSNINLSLAWRALRASDYWWLAAALLAFGAGNLARAFRWRSLFVADRRPPLGAVWNAMMVGYLYNNIMPARAGEAARVVVLTQRSPAPATEVVGTVVIERLYDVVAILLIFFIAKPWLPHVSWFDAAAIVALILATIIIICAAALTIYGDRPLRLLLHPFRRLPLFSGERFDRTIDELAYGLSGLRHPRLAAEASLWTIAAWLCTSLCAYFVSVSFNLHLPLACGILVAIAIGLGMILPSPPAAVGVFEAAALIALAAYSIPHSSALPYAIVLHIVNFIPFIIIGLLTLHYNSRHPSNYALEL